LTQKLERARVVARRRACVGKESWICGLCIRFLRALLFLPFPVPSLRWLVDRRQKINIDLVIRDLPPSLIHTISYSLTPEVPSPSK
jgi:hypothetical protein